MVNNFEKLARSLLWLSLSAVCLLVPLGLAEQQKAQAKAANDATAAAAKALAEAAAAAKDDAPRRVTLGDVGVYFSGLNLEKGVGKVWFTNAKPSGGAICVRGVATARRDDALRVETLVICRVLQPFESSVLVEVPFAGGNLDEVCPETGACVFKLLDVAW